MAASDRTATNGGGTRRVVVLVVFFAVTFAAAGIGSRFLPGAWYAGLVKPSWNPPNWIFAPVWSVLYVMIAIAGALAFNEDRRSAANIAWALQIVLNCLWSYLFFGLHRPGLAAIDIVALWCSIGTFVMLARRDSPAASLLFLPYWAWVTFASALNFAIVALN